MYSKLYCIIWYFACLHKYPKWIVLSSYAMISIELCILCSIGNRFGSVRLVLGGCQWPALGRNLHNFIWIVALINCPRFPLSTFPFLVFSLFLFFYFIACILLWHSKHSFYFFMCLCSSLHSYSIALLPSLYWFPCSLLHLTFHW